MSPRMEPLLVLTFSISIAYQELCHYSASFLLNSTVVVHTDLVFHIISGRMVLMRIISAGRILPLSPGGSGLPVSKRVHQNLSGPLLNPSSRLSQKCLTCCHNRRFCRYVLSILPYITVVFECVLCFMTAHCDRLILRSTSGSCTRFGSFKTASKFQLSQSWITNQSAIIIVSQPGDQSHMHR